MKETAEARSIDDCSSHLDKHQLVILTTLWVPYSYTSFSKWGSCLFW